MTLADHVQSARFVTTLTSNVPPANSMLTALRDTVYVHGGGGGVPPPPPPGGGVGVPPPSPVGGGGGGGQSETSSAVPSSSLSTPSPKSQGRRGFDPVDPHGSIRGRRPESCRADAADANKVQAVRRTGTEGRCRISGVEDDDVAQSACRASFNPVRRGWIARRGDPRQRDLVAAHLAAQPARRPGNATTGGGPVPTVTMISFDGGPGTSSAPTPRTRT